MPIVQVPAPLLLPFGAAWQTNGQRLSRTPPFSSNTLGRVFERAVAESLAALLGGVSVIEQRSTSLVPPQADCVEVGQVLSIGGVRPQNFDVVYRPDGIRFAFDAKTLNDVDSVRKNWQNMVNDLATEATTIHSRFPYAVVAFLVAIPRPSLPQPQESAIIDTLERLDGRSDISDPLFRAEARSLVIWDPSTGDIDANVPQITSPLRLERFSEMVQDTYVGRYKGLPPHTA